MGGNGILVQIDSAQRVMRFLQTAIASALFRRL
jgi:hypothetical protein